MLVLFMLACSYVRGNLGFEIDEKIILKSNDQWLLVVHSEEKTSNDNSYLSTGYDTYSDVLNSNETNSNETNEDICSEYRAALAAIYYEQGNDSYNQLNLSVGPRNDSLYSLNVYSENLVYLWQSDNSHGYETYVPIYSGISKDIETRLSGDSMLIRGTSKDALEFKITAPICEIYSI